jgi:hypothetical protein
MLSVGVLGCASFDAAMQGTEDHLRKPLVPGTTQPTNEQAIQSAASAIGPWATLATGIGLYALHEYNSSRRNKKTLDALNKGE